MILRKIVNYKNKKGKKQDILLEEGKSVKIGKGNAELFVVDGQCKMCCYSGVKLYGRPTSGEKILRHEVLIELDTGEVFIFRDEEGEAKRKREANVKVKTVKETEEDYDTEKLRSEIEISFNKFIKENKNCRNIRTFAFKLCKYTREYCEFERSIFYILIGIKKDGKRKIRFKPIFGMAPEDSYNPPISILKEVFNTGAPVLKIIKEIDEEKLSLSIVENKIDTAMCFPIYNKFDNPIAAFYGDSSGKSVPEESFLKISYICGYISPYLTSFSLKNLSNNPPILKVMNLENDGKIGFKD